MDRLRRQKNNKIKKALISILLAGVEQPLLFAASLVSGFDRLDLCFLFFLFLFLLLVVRHFMTSYVSSD